MATNTGAVTDPDLWKEQQRFYNFLQHYDLLKYHQRFQRMGVLRLTHFKDVTDADLDAVGLTPPEKTRLRKKLDENFSVAGKLKKKFAGKSHAFDGEPGAENVPPSPDPTPQEATLIAKEDIKLVKKIGEGAHGTVFEGTWSNKHGSVVVAVKTLYGKDEVHTTFIKEAQSMRALLHQHIIQLYGLVLSAPLMLVQELAPCGDLHSFLQKHGATKNVALFHKYAAQIADAMKYLEDKRIVHRDLAARNILLAAEDFLKLSDFGMARLLDEQTGVYNLSNLQSRIPIAWTSLEALTSAKFSSASDVWSFAVTLWEIYSLGAVPWKGLTPIEIRDNLVQGERLGCPERCPTEIYHIMTSSWEARPQDRPTFTSIYQTLQKSPPSKIRAIKTHTVAADEDNNCLSFQKEDIIFLINKPKQGWLYGMLDDGKIGYFLEDHVTTFIDPIGDIKVKLQTGKAKVTDLPISGPTLVCHDTHWDKNGEKWGKTKEELLSSNTHPPRSPHNSPPFRVVNSSPAHSPALKQKPRNGSSFPDTPDTRYSTQSPILSGSDVGSPTPSPLTGIPSGSNSKDVPPHDQYVTMRRGHTMATEPEENPEEEDPEDYIEMNPDQSQQLRPDRRVPSMYENVRQVGSFDEEEFYSVPRPRSALPSSSSSNDGDSSRPGSKARNRLTLPPRGDSCESPESNRSDKRSLTLPAAVTTNRIPSQYSVASQVSQEFLTSPTDAITPTRVRYLPTAVASGAVPGGDMDATAESSPTLGDVAQMMRSEGASLVNRSPEKPRPRPRKGVARSTSAASPSNSPSDTRKSSLPNTHLNGRHPLPTQPGEDTSQSPTHNHHNTHQAPNSGGTEPLIPNRTYLDDKPAGADAEQPPPFDNPLAREFPDAAPELCRKTFEMYRSDMTKAREEIQVQILLGMRIPYTNTDDCHRALKHCQYKIDRAASWLVERSQELENRKV